VARRIVVVGLDAAGGSAASQAKRQAGDAVEVIAFERQQWTSYSACGIPYWVAGDVAGPDALIARTPQEHRDRGIDVRTGMNVESIDLAAREVLVRSVDASGGSERVGFDELVIGTGAVPIRPPLPGIDAEGVFGVQTIDDGAAVLRWVESRDRSGSACRTVVIGGGYIGIEMAEAMKRHGFAVTLVDKAAEPMSTLDPDMGRRVREEMQGFGVDVVTNAGVEGIETDADGCVRAVVTERGTYPADVVILGLGVRPNTALAQEAGLSVGASGGITTDRRMRVVDADGVWAAGDCVEVLDRITSTRIHVPLGTHANKQGKVLGINVAGGYATFPGIVRTAISKVCGLEIARTGLREVDAVAAGFEIVSATIDSTTKAGYFPGAEEMTIKVIAERTTARLLGVQIVGGQGAAKRIDAAAVALWNGMGADEVAMLDLAYAPPFAPVWDPMLVAARKAADLALA
jgi:NADPH-dependent 2,4-dienoyl-CoA reductase/sulfur reductase-like enzyme